MEQSGGAIVDTIKKIPIWAWIAIGVVIIAGIVVLIYFVWIKPAMDKKSNEEEKKDTDTQTSTPTIPPATTPPPPSVVGGPTPSDTQKVPGYVFYQGYDSNEGDLKRNAANTNNPAMLAAECSELPNCLGFNTNGYLKASTLPLTEWRKWTTDPSGGFYLRYPAPIPTPA